MKHNRMIAGILALILAFGSGGCSSGPDDFNASQKGATEATRQKNEEVYRQLDFNNKDEINAAAKGLLDSPESLEIKDEDGSVIWSQKAFSFVTEGWRINASSTFTSFQASRITGRQMPEVTKRGPQSQP